MEPDRRVWLKSVQIANFRGYGPDFELDLPTQGCVVLLSGANGLGKTSFFEAIEWALTSKIARLERFSKPSRLELIRKSSDISKCEVALTFLDPVLGARMVERRCVLSEAGEMASGTHPDAIVALLRNADQQWAVSPENLIRYLFLTHIHPQSAPLRLVARSAEDRWGWVSQLAGTERLETVRQHVRASKNSLTRLAGDREQALKSRIQERADWDAWVEQYVQLREQATALSGAVTPDDALAGLRRLRAALSNQAVDLGDGGDGAAMAAVVDATATLDSRRKELQAERVLLASQREAASRWAVLQGEIRAKVALADDVSKRLVMLREDLGKRDVAAAKHRSASLNADAAEQGLRRLGDTIAEVLEARRQRLAASETVERLLGEILSRERQLEEHRAAVARATQDLATRHALEREIGEAERQRATIETTRKEAAQLPALRQELGRLVESSQALLSEARDIERQQAATREALKVASAELQTSEQELNAVQRAANAVSQSVASIAAHLHEEDKECPVCKSTFPEPGTLKRLAEGAATLLDPAIAGAQTKVSRLVQAVEAVRDQLSRLQRAASTKTAEIESSSNVQRDLEEKVAAVLSLPLLVGLPEAEIAVALERRESSSTATLVQLNAKKRELEQEESLARKLREASVEFGELTRIQDNARAEELATRRRIAELAAIDGKLTEFQIAADELEAALQARHVSANAAFGAAKVESDRLRSVFNEASQDRNQLRDQMNALVAQEKRTREESRDLGERAAELVKGWPVRLGESPSELAIDKAEAQLAQDGAALDQLTSDLQRIASGLQEWMRAEQLRDLERRLRNRAGTRTFEEESARLDTMIVAARRDHETALKVRQAADRLGDALRDRTSSFNQLVLEPIQGLFARYLRALIHDERFHHVGFEPQTGSKAGSLHFQLRVPDWEALEDVEAEMILSEGQLAELSLAALFATSSAYRWSDWRALLLDDPTQYNDLVHATSLLEVVRNLAYFEQYQVFISTHDLQQAAFFRRKLEAMRVPWVECRFDSHGEQGLEYAVTSAGEGSGR